MKKIDLAIQVSSIQEKKNLSSIFIRMQSPSVCTLVPEVFLIVRRFAALSQLSHAVKYQEKPLGPG